MNNQEKIIKELAYYFSKTLPEGEWDFFEFGNVNDHPQPQIFYFDKLSGQGGSYYSLNPKAVSYTHLDVYKRQAEMLKLTTWLILLETPLPQKENIG